MIQAQFKYGIGLLLTELVAAVCKACLVANKDAYLLDRCLGEVKGEQLDLCLFTIGGLADDADKLIKLAQRDEVALQCFRPSLGFLKIKSRATHHHFAPVLDIAIYQLLEPQHLGTAMVNGQHIGCETGLQRRMLIEIIDDNLRHGVSF